MCPRSRFVLLVILTVTVSFCGCGGSYDDFKQSVPLRGPPVVESAPLLLNSFLPAGMQVIAHLTDLMKYEIKPAPVGTATTSTTTTVRPTSHHKPGVYSPRNPPGPSGYFTRHSSYQEYVQRLTNNSPSRGGFNYFDRYNFDSKSSRAMLPDDLDSLLGQVPSELLRRVNKFQEDYDFADAEQDLQRFTDDYEDDTDVRAYVIGNKKSPPTRAYVTLLSLYELLNKESKKLQLNKYGGYADEVLRVLIETSTGTAASQLRSILARIMERRDTNDLQIINKMKALSGDLEQSDSYLNDALRYIPPLKFAS